jgi:hypothetical protein
MIKAVALLHERQRQRTTVRGKEILLATVEDYAVARRLLLASINETLVNVPGRAARVYEKLRARFPDGFNSNQLLPTYFNNKMTRDRTLGDLQEIGVLRCVSQGVRGRPARYEWIREIEPVLPTVQAVATWLEAARTESGRTPDE